MAQNWNLEVNPLPSEAKFYLNNFRNGNLSNPVGDLTDIMIDCYEALTIISDKYSPTGDKYQDESIKHLRKLLKYWSKDDIENYRESIENTQVSTRRNSNQPPPRQHHVFRESFLSLQEEHVDEEENNSATSSGTLSHNLSDSTSKKQTESLPPPPDVYTPSPPAPVTVTEVRDEVTERSRTSGSNNKNNEYFLKLKEDDALAKKIQEEAEAKMKPEERLKLQEERRLAEERDKSKTAHLSNLGSKYMPGKKKNDTGEIVIERGGGGRGRGRGRGGN